MLRRLKRCGYLKDSIKFQDLLDRYDEDLFISMSKAHHCLYHILPPARHLDSLRESGHPFSLPDFSTSTHKKSFVVRTLYNFIRPPGTMSSGRAYVLPQMYLISPHVLRGPSTDRPETLPHDQNLAVFYNPTPKIRGALPPPKKNWGPKTKKEKVQGHAYIIP